MGKVVECFLAQDEVDSAVWQIDGLGVDLAELNPFQEPPGLKLAETGEPAGLTRT